MAERKKAEINEINLIQIMMCHFCDINVDDNQWLMLDQSKEFTKIDNELQVYEKYWNMNKVNISYTIPSCSFDINLLN